MELFMDIVHWYVGFMQEYWWQIIIIWFLSIIIAGRLEMHYLDIWIGVIAWGIFGLLKFLFWIGVLQ